MEAFLEGFFVIVLWVATPSIADSSLGQNQLSASVMRVHIRLQIIGHSLQVSGGVNILHFDVIWHIQADGGVV